MSSKATRSRSHHVGSMRSDLLWSERVWSERVWPVLAGALTGLGAIGVWSAYGPAGLLIGPLGTYVFVTVMLYGTTNEAGFTLAWSLRTGLVATVVLMDLTGLLLLSPFAGGIAAGVVALSCPMVTNRLASKVRRRTRRPAHRPHGPRLDQAEVDRAFARLVSGL
jgi:hypothetical protein